jgi:RNA polymerase sigma-70 factor (ECF subfamily)
VRVLTGAGEIAPIVERTPATAEKLASRARRKVQGTPTPRASGSSTSLSSASRPAEPWDDLPGVLASS